MAVSGFVDYSVDDLAEFLLDQEIPGSIVSVFTGRSGVSVCYVLMGEEGL